MEKSKVSSEPPEKGGVKRFKKETIKGLLRGGSSESMDKDKPLTKTQIKGLRGSIVKKGLLMFFNRRRLGFMAM